MLLRDVAEEDLLVGPQIHGLWPVVLEQIWRDQALRNAVLAKVALLFWEAIWPSLKQRRVFRVIPVSALKPLFVQVFGEPPAANA